MAAPAWLIASLIVLLLLAALAVSVSNVVLYQVITRVDHLQHQVCMLEHRPPSCHTP